MIQQPTGSTMKERHGSYHEEDQEDEMKTGNPELDNYNKVAKTFKIDRKVQQVDMTKLHNRIFLQIDNFLKWISCNKKVPHEGKGKLKQSQVEDGPLIKINRKKVFFFCLALLAVGYPFIDLIINFSEPPSECLEGANLGDCGGISHIALSLLLFLLVLIWGLGTENKSIRLWTLGMCKLAVSLLIAQQIFRYIVRVRPTPHNAVIKGAYVLNMPKCVGKWQRMSTMLSSFPEGVVERATSRRWVGRFGFSDTKYSVSMAHMMALESISKRDVGEEGANGQEGTKYWYLVFEDDATTLLDKSTLYDSLNQMLSQVPPNAEAVNLGPSRARLRLFGSRMNCRFFGYDPTTLLASLISLPYKIPAAITGIKQLSSGGGRGGSSFDAVISGGAASPGEMVTVKQTRSLASNEVYLYRTFGTCRQAYAVTPEGARWMMATVLRSMLIDGWGSGGGDSILASAAIRDIFTHQTFFMRLFEQDEWCDPDNTFSCTYSPQDAGGMNQVL